MEIKRVYNIYACTRLIRRCGFSSYINAESKFAYAFDYDAGDAAVRKLENPRTGKEKNPSGRNILETMTEA